MPKHKPKPSVPSPHTNEGHEVGATYRCRVLRVTYLPHGCIPRTSPWIRVIAGNVQSLSCATAAEAMRMLGQADTTKWEYTP
jgi:hypothetical protein